jgi:hypothetical protein
VERKGGEELPAARFLAAVHVRWEATRAARLDRRPAPGFGILPAYDGVDQQQAVFGGGVLQPTGEREHGCLKVIGVADQPRGAGNAAMGPRNDKLVCVMGVEVEDVVLGREVAECPAAERDQADVSRTGQAPTETWCAGGSAASSRSASAFPKVSATSAMTWWRSSSLNTSWMSAHCNA